MKKLFSFLLLLVTLSPFSALAVDEVGAPMENGYNQADMDGREIGAGWYFKYDKKGYTTDDILSGPYMRKSDCAAAESTADNDKVNVDVDGIRKSCFQFKGWQYILIELGGVRTPSSVYATLSACSAGRTAAMTATGGAGGADPCIESTTLITTLIEDPRVQSWVYIYKRSGDGDPLSSSLSGTEASCLQRQSVQPTPPAEKIIVSACYNIGGSVLGSAAIQVGEQTVPGTPVVPLSVSAGSEITYTLLAPIPGVTDTELVPYLISALKFLIGGAGLVGVIRLVICGFSLLLAPGASQREHAKECLWKIVLGLLLALSAFILLRSINPDLITPTFEPPATTSAEGAEVPPSGGSQKMCGSFAVTPANCNNNVPSTTYSPNAEAGARMSLPSGIGVNSNMCVDSCACSCTNIQGLPQSVLTELIRLRQAAGGANITITGGTEAHLHRSHFAGQPIFDIGKSGPIDAAIRQGPSRSSFGGYTEWRGGNFWYTDEGNHWHVCAVGTNTTYCRP